MKPRHPANSAGRPRGRHYGSLADLEAGRRRGYAGGLIPGAFACRGSGAARAHGNTHAPIHYARRACVRPFRGEARRPRLRPTRNASLIKIH
jgi:hypothetical protein